MQLAPNLVVAERFRLNKVIGRGGMGSVWQATHLGLDIPCAVKFIEGPYASSPEAQSRFEREAKAAAQLRSPHVVQILDHGVWQGRPYLAMELLEGEDLGQRLKRVGRLHPKDVCHIIAQVTRALTKAHAAGIVHRDLKPDNIFLVRDDDREIAKVLDFGIAKAAHNAIEGSATKTGAMLGTPYYMSPEQAQGTKAVDHRSDLWALAVIVYQAITGKLPFESEALGDLLMRIIIAPMPVPSAELPGLPPMFDRWWATAASRDPAHRFQSAKDLLDGLLVTFGQSQLTDMMDRNELRAVMDMPSAPRGGLPFTTPHPHNMTPNPAGTMPVSQPGFAGQQGVAGQQGYAPQQGFAPPQGFGSAPGFSAPFPGHGTPPPHATTGAPLAQTFGPTPSPPKNRAPLVVGICAGVALLGGVILAAALMARGHGRDATAASPAAETTASAVASATPPPAPAPVDTAPPAASVVLAPPASDPPASEKEAAAPSAAPAQPGTAHPWAAPPAFPGGQRFPGGARPAPTAAPKKPGSVDLGI